MDPVTIATTVAKTAQTAWDVGAGLCQLVPGTRVINETVKNLSAEVTQLGNVCDAVRRELETLAQQYKIAPEVRGMEERRRDARLGDGIKEQLAECGRSMEKLREALSSVRRDRSNFLTQTGGWSPNTRTCSSIILDNWLTSHHLSIDKFDST